MSNRPDTNCKQVSQAHHDHSGLLKRREAKRGANCCVCLVWLLKRLLYKLHLQNCEECKSGIQLFRERLSEKMCTRQSRKVIWDMRNTLFLTLKLSNLLLLLSFSTHRHMSVASRAILSNFFEKQ